MTPAASILAHSSNNKSMDNCELPGMDEIGLFTFVPGQTNNGMIKSSALMDVSEIMLLRIGFFLRRRSLVTGNDICYIFLLLKNRSISLAKLSASDFGETTSG